MPIRNDIHGGPSVPAAITEYLLRKFGKNPHGEPIFRLVWSLSRLHWKGGRFNDWDDSIATHERGGLIRLKSGVLVPNGHNPLRTVVEVRQVRKYAFDAGWVLERWIPPNYYGSKLEWERRCLPGFPNIPLSGPFPGQGDYEMVHNSASREVPTISQLQNAIDRCEHSRNTHRGSVESQIRERHERFLDEYNLQLRKEREEYEAFVRDVMTTIYSDSLNAGAMRTKMAAQAGITEHVGN